MPGRDALGADILGSKLQHDGLRRAVASALLAGALLSSACSGDDDDDASAGAAASSGVGSGGKGGRGGSPSDGASAGRDAEIPVAEGGSADDGSMAGQPAGGSAAPHFPCEVEAVIVAKCQRCHQEPPQNGAPFPLLTWQDTRRSHGTVLVFEAMLPAIESDFMPLTQLELEPPVEPLEPEEKELMLEWLGSGAPAALGPACD